MIGPVAILKRYGSLSGVRWGQPSWEGVSGEQFEELLDFMPAGGRNSRGLLYW